MRSPEVTALATVTALLNLEMDKLLVSKHLKYTMTASCRAFSTDRRKKKTIRK